MSLKQDIKSGIITAMKTKDSFTRDALKVIKGEVETAEGKLDGDKELSDAEVQKIISKSVKNLEMVGTDEAKKEIELLSSFLPKQMTEDDIAIALAGLVESTGASSMADMGKVMGAFNAKYSGKADGKVVSTMVKSLLN